MRTAIIPNSPVIIRKRVLSGLNKSDVAKAAGIPHSSVIRAESGKSVSPKTATGICKALGKTVFWAFGIGWNTVEPVAPNTKNAPPEGREHMDSQEGQEWQNGKRPS